MKQIFHDGKTAPISTRKRHTLSKSFFPWPNQIFSRKTKSNFEILETEIRRKLEQKERASERRKIFPKPS